MSGSENKSEELMVPLTKISPPELPKILLRPRLRDFFEQNEDKNLLLIIGQAAQGKTTLAASCFQNSGRPSGWINLDQEDSDPVNLFYLLVRALRHRLGGEGAEAILSLPVQSRGLQEDLFRYRDWAAALFKIFPQTFQIVFDGLDRLTPQAESFRFFQVLIETLPPSCRFILLSRYDPPFTENFHDPRMACQTLMLNNADLAFSPPEIKQYFKEFHGLSLKAGQVERIHQTTEGWIGGITLLSETLHQLPQRAVEDFLRVNLPDRFQGDAFQYFGKEVFAALSPARKTFLSKSSILERLEPEVLQTLFPEERGEDLLLELRRKNLFVQAFHNQEQKVVFRYHQLFKDFLGALLRSNFPEEEIRLIHSRAGAYYEKKGEVEEAIAHFLKARSFPEAADLIKQIGLTLIKKARLADLKGWLQALPKELIQADPWLILFELRAEKFIFEEEKIQLLRETVHRFKKEGDYSGQLLGLAFLIETEFFFGRYIPELLDEAETLMEGLEQAETLYEQAELLCQIGMVQSIRGNIRKGYRAAQRSYLLANRLADLQLKAFSLSNAVSALSILGELREAERFLQELNALCWNSPSTDVRARFNLLQLLYQTFNGSIQKGLALCEAVLEDLDKFGLTYLQPFALLQKQGYLIYSGNYEQSEPIGRQLLFLAEAFNNGFMKGIVATLSGLAAYWGNKPGVALPLIEQGIAWFEAGESRSEGHLATARLIRSLLNNTPEHRRKALQEVREVLASFEEIESHLFIVECHMALGILHHDAGEEGRAAGHLREGFRLAGERDFRHFINISPRDTARACLLALETLGDKDGPGLYAYELLIKKFAPLAPEVLEEWAEHPDRSMRQRVGEIQRVVRRAWTSFLRLHTFGGLRLFFGDKEMEDKAWDRHQPRRLLMAILSRKNEKISKEVLIEALWPEEKPGVGEKNFKTTLQRLRKSLEPDLSPVFGSSYLHLRQNQVFLDEELCRVDVKEFCFFYQKGQELEKAGDGPKALDYFTQALNLYQGDFLPEEQYAPWVINRREELKEIYLDLLTRMARYHEQAGTLKKAASYLKQAIAAEPLREEAYRSLMTLYADSQMVNEALRIYEACRKALKVSLDTGPDPVTKALFQGIKKRMK
jgi:LuxR family transcriptional regulator, maltose regulon positive regulatory protein